MATVKTRRNFLLAAPIAAVAVSPFTDTLLRASMTGQADKAPTLPIPFQVFDAEAMAANLKDVQSNHGTKPLLSPKGSDITMVINEETNKVAKEFEFHAKRDHVFQVLAGETTYELGGTPKNARETKPGEFLAPESDGHKTVTLKQGDYLFVPRMTPHKRITEGSVSLLLISAE
jgi:mannose-6-phosphate isomerase-like protein (cupin superfamily)